ncbi:phosphoribosyltransferase family protein [Thioclava sp. DLFJ4-1]|uniref:phosphoribosyltransferase n=1 Tax=Thioclava sp. DLFJ4-1 TaxID=1915313 RepID=UPI000997E8AF|nr:phosphoribosyltransferase family protein [Thioclava sp. DLFJ4-1]OOY16376.1 hypothetical protein BMI85_12860 [Thioclava sp. DLFJ4-1]
MSHLERYTDRTEAGIVLARQLEAYRGRDAVVLALPRGGVPVAWEVAERLDLPLDLVFVRKLGAPSNPEVALAAIAGLRGEVLVRNADVIRASGCDEATLEGLAAREREVIADRIKRYGAPGLPLAGRVAIIVDDGVATGATMRAALRAVRAAGPEELVCAIPVASEDALEAIRTEADRVICPLVPSYFGAVGAYYTYFGQVPDAEVAQILATAQARPSRKDRA